VDGLIHESELLKEKNADNYPQGSTLKVEILRIEAFDHRISLSEKSANEEEGSVNDYIVSGSSTSAQLDEVLGDMNFSDEDSSSEDSSEG
jgi:ribosomal protein S1